MSRDRQASTLFEYLVRLTDFVSRKVQGIEEFDPRDDCLLRIALRRARRDLFVDEVAISARDIVVEIHLWNEHLPMPRGRPDLAWVAAGYRQFERSLQMLAEHMHAERRFDNVRAVMMTPALADDDLERHLRRMRYLLGDAWSAVALDRTLPGLLHQFADDVWLWFLTKAFEPGAPSRAHFFRRRQEFWISRDRFLALYGDKLAAASP